MHCQKCNSYRVLIFNAHHTDTCHYEFKGINLGEYTGGYAPEIEGLCGGDNIGGEICLDCGQIQGKWPRTFELPEREDDTDYGRYCDPLHGR